MSTIQEVRAAEKKVQEVPDALKKASARDPNHLSAQLTKATEGYARAVRGLDTVSIPSDAAIQKQAQCGRRRHSHILRDAGHCTGGR
jgi:hypothetical protein